MEQERTNFGFSLPDGVLHAISLLNEAGYEAYAVGGAVRDLLRGVTPHDYDITTSATPDEMKGVFSAFRTIETGIAHGTLTVLIGGAPLEITTFRVDGRYTDSRHPDEVTFTRSLREDAARRDFTVNAMAYHPTLGLFDFFGGEDDLNTHLLRTVGESRRRFSEDALRILRALRFAATLGYRIEEKTADAIHALAPTLACVSPERIREEFLKLLIAPNAAEVLRAYSDVVSIFIPEIAPLIGAEQYNPHHDYDIWEHTLHALDAAESDPVLRLAAFFHDIGKPRCFFRDADGIGHFYGHAAQSAEIADTVLRRLRFDNATRERVVLLVRMHDTVPAPKTRQFGRIRSKHGDRFLRDWLALIRADRTGQKVTMPSDVALAIEEAEEEAQKLLRSEERISLATLRLRGGDLLALGYQGKEVGALLSSALDGVIEGRVENEKESLLRYLTSAPAPIECERKFLILRPKSTLLLEKGAVASEITQTYLLGSPEVTARVRCRVFSDRVSYTHTQKKKISQLSAYEEEREITQEEYAALLTHADPKRTPIKKTRYALPYEGHLLEIDIYPFWNRQAVLEIELKSEDEAFSLPDFITVIREVTADGAYRNAALARSIPKEEDTNLIFSSDEY